ncbi:AMIN-like domain-containing (lipo)protein [Blastococcus sp. SYSU D00695]
MSADSAVVRTTPSEVAMSPRSRVPVRLATALTGGAVLALTALAAPASATPGCTTVWGSLPESATGGGAGTVDDVRTGRHDCYDRLVVVIDGAAGTAVGYRVEYVPQFRADGSGEAVPLSGGADLQVVVAEPAYDADGDATYVPGVVDVTGYTTFRQVAWGGSFEGHTTLGLGVRARLPFRVFVLDGPGDDARLVVDVAHTW